MGNTYIESETAPIGDFINKVEALKVPVFQRSFAWTEDEIKLLWDDITAIIELPQPEYFLGSMVFKKKDGYYEIIDGQQRITAIYIILSCIRNIYRINSDTQRNEWFNREYFGKIDINTLTINSKFQMNEINNPFFQKYIVSESNIEEIEENIKNLPKKDTNHLLGKAIKQIYSLLIERQKEFSGTEFSSDALLSIHNIIQKHIYVLILKVSDEADAYTIFETLNDRGLGLTTMELLKNHIFEKSGMYLPSVQNEWSILRDNLLHSDPSDRFIHHYWTSIHGRTSKPQLFRLMRKQVNTPIQAVEFARSLRTSARLYAAFGNPNDDYWNDHEKQTRDNLEVLDILDAQQVMPVLLAAVQKFNPTEFRKLTYALVVMAVRYNLIGELRTGVISNYYSDIPKKIHSGELNKSIKVCREFRSIYPTDEEFEEAFSTKVLSDAKKSRYLLIELEKNFNGGSSQVSNDPRKVNLEHILPQNPSNEWIDTITQAGDDLRKYIYKLGNQALVSTTPNKKSGAKGFIYKNTNLYSKETQIYYTHMLTQYSTWLPADIIRRQKELAKQAVKTWRIEFS